MYITINNKKFYRTSEAAKRVGVSRSTLLRWFRTGTLKNSITRDRRGWRLFSEDDIEKIEAEVNHTG